MILVRNSYLFELFNASTELQSAQWIDVTGIPWHIVWMPRNREFFTLISGGLSGLAGWGNMPLSGRIISGGWFLLLTGLLIRSWRKKSFSLQATNLSVVAPYGVLLAWAGLTALILNLNSLGLPSPRFVDNFAAIISIYIPMSLLGGALLAWVSGQLAPGRWVGPITATLITVGTVGGTATLLDVVKFSAILIQPSDLHAMAWIQQNTPSEAHFAVNVWRWAPGIYAGTDGGYWLPLLTDRTSVVPPAIIYPLASGYHEFQATNALLQPLSQTQALNNPDFRAQLRRNGVTHIYIGARGGPLDAKNLLTQPFVELIYNDGPIYIFKLIP